jgi:lysozyme
MNLDLLQKQLQPEEELRLKPYRDSAGKLTIGWGRNLDDRGITTDEATYLLKNDIALVVKQLAVNLPWTSRLDDVRWRVLADMCFNMGIGGLLEFKNTLAAIERGDYAAAATGMLASKWDTQVAHRAAVLAEMMRTGQDPA